MDNHKRETYKSDDIEFTVEENQWDYWLQFQKYPDKLRAKKLFDKINLGRIGDIDIISDQCMHFNGFTLCLRGNNRDLDNKKIALAKSQISKDFFQKLLDLLENNMKTEIKESKMNGVVSNIKMPDYRIREFDGRYTIEVCVERVKGFLWWKDIDITWETANTHGSIWNAHLCQEIASYSNYEDAVEKIISWKKGIKYYYPKEEESL